MYDYFHLKRGETKADTSMDMLAVVGTSLGDDGYTDPIFYATSLRSGAFNNTTHDPFSGLPAENYQLLPSLAGTASDGQITWNPGDAIQVTWVGGDYPTSTPDGRSKVSSTAYVNLSTGERIESSMTDGNIELGGATMLNVTGPESWDPVFNSTKYDDIYSADPGVTSTQLSPIYTDPFVTPLPIN